MLSKLWSRKLAETSSWVTAIDVEVAQDGGTEVWIGLGVCADHILRRELGRTVTERSAPVELACQRRGAMSSSREAYGLTGTVGVCSVIGISSALPYVAHVEE